MMHKLVGIGLIIILIGYAVWTVTAGSSAAPDETVAVNSNSARHASGEKSLEIMSLLRFDAIPSI
jgi:hypothetical protein